ncbi:hypothetical protein B0O99DRAFT_688345 [Bisporella sp. PMI_857]|nr:hypothetical protein B0O99DRAFT_688345 [Bisporella sp. PMI_857]
MGAGTALTTLPHAIQTPLAESDVAHATAPWVFWQSLGFVWGIAMPSSIFENKFQAMPHQVGDALIRKEFEVKGAYEYASKAYIGPLDHEVQSQVIRLFIRSLDEIWLAGSGIAIWCFMISFLIQEVRLRERLETEFEYGTEVSQPLQTLRTSTRITKWAP